MISVVIVGIALKWTKCAFFGAIVSLQCKVAQVMGSFTSNLSRAVFQKSNSTLQTNRATKEIEVDAIRELILMTPVFHKITMAIVKEMIDLSLGH